MAKLKARKGYRFVKELGGAVRRGTVSAGAAWLVDNGFVRGRVLDFGCGFGFDADQFGWDAYDPHYRQRVIEGSYDTVVCNHVLNMLTRQSRAAVVDRIRQILSSDGASFLIVPRNIPQRGKVAMRKRIQNYVVLELPTVHVDPKLEIYRMGKDGIVKDKTDELERRLARC